jgi:vacuolar-type H+-ATPase subunit H
LDVLHLIDRLEELVAEARRMPIGQGVVVDRRRILELVDQMRSSVPWEVKQAQEIVAEKEALLEEARREGEGIVARAEMDAQAKLDDTEIVKAAEREAKDISSRAEQRAQTLLDETQETVTAKLRQAENSATQQMDEADRYALEMLRRLEAQLSAFSSTVRAGIGALEDRQIDTQPFANNNQRGDLQE